MNAHTSSPFTIHHRLHPLYLLRLNISRTTLPLTSPSSSHCWVNYPYFQNFRTEYITCHSATMMKSLMIPKIDVKCEIINTLMLSLNQ